MEAVVEKVAEHGDAGHNAEEMKAVIKVDISKCVQCYACIASCPIKTCQNAADKGGVTILHDECIGCGTCIQACTHGARTVLDDIEEFLSDIKKPKDERPKLIAIAAPALVSNWPGQHLNMNGFFKQHFGIEAVFDVSFGAELTIHSYLQYKKEHNPEFIISQPCPPIVDFIEIYQPELIPALIPVDSPMAHTMKMIREFFPEWKDHKIVVFSPCVAKRREFDEIGHGDYNVTFVSLKKYMAANTLNAGAFPETPFDGPVAERAATFSQPGGLLTVATREDPWFWEKTRKLESPPTVYPYLIHLGETYGRKKRTVFMIDCLSCEKGCNGGPGTGFQKKNFNELEAPVGKRRIELEHYWANRPAGEPTLHETIEKYWKPGLYDRRYKDMSEHIILREPTDDELEEIYKSMGKFSDKDIYDCIACGYNSCKTMAIAIFNGLNVPRNCQHYDMYLLHQQEVSMRHMTHELQIERDEMQVMKDNLHMGMFLMEKDLKLQGSYSRALEDILGLPDLEAKVFTDLLSASLRGNEEEVLKDYFGMVFNKAFEKEMLDDINPIKEFRYTDPSTGRHKILHCTFALIEEEEELEEGEAAQEPILLGTVEDVTAEKELQRELEEVQARAQAEMRSLFEILNVEPAVLNDFIEDSNYEFEKVNNIMKDNSLDTKQALVNLYQSIHSIKANSVILNLESFSTKLHDLETKIKGYRDESDVPFDAMLNLTMDLEKMMHEMDLFKETVSKLRNFSSGGVHKTDTGDVLTTALEKTVEKVAQDQGKQVKFITDEMNHDLIARLPRRIIKEVLIQLIRNSVVHGIEKKEDRIARGKSEVGNIKLSATQNEDGLIQIKLQDDGAGLHYEKIKEKALAQGLLKPEEAEDRNKLIAAMFAPGFSTADSVDMHAGRGVGLSLVKDRIKEAGGKIKVQSESGKGTAFFVVMPPEEK